MQTLTPTVATAVLNAASGTMIAEGSMPESDDDRVAEATRIITLAEQAREVADQVGHANVPRWPVIERVLQEAGRLTPSPVGDQPPPPAPPPAPVDQPVQAPQPPPSPTPSGPAEGQVWIDDNGGQWEITRYSGGPQMEARSVATGELTVLPAGFLKSRVEAPPAPAQQPPAPTPAPPAPTPPPVAQEPPPQPAPAPPPAPVDPTPSPEVVSQAPAPEAAAAPADRSQAQAFTAPVDDHEGDEKYEELLDGVTANYTPAGMPVPMDLERPPSVMPDDLTMVSDIAARALHSQFNALASRARYLHGLESAKARACARVKKSYLKHAMRQARSELGKDASVTEVTQLAEEQDDDVATWLEREERHSDRAKAYETFLHFYTEDVSVLSRDWTMRAREESGS